MSGLNQKMQRIRIARLAGQNLPIGALGLGKAARLVVQHRDLNGRNGQANLFLTEMASATSTVAAVKIATG